jgi:hypothetical protein
MRVVGAQLMEVSDVGDARQRGALLWSGARHVTAGRVVMGPCVEARTCG